MKINTNVFTCPDLDSDSESEELYVSYKRRFGFKQYKSREYQKNLIKLGCHYDPLQEYKKIVFQNPKCYDQQYDIKLNQHKLKVQKEIESMLENERKKKEEDKKRVEAILREFNSLSVEEEKKMDKAFEEELKQQRKAVEEAIAYDRKKLENESANAEKIKKDLQDKEEKKKQIQEKNNKLKEMQKSSATSLEGLKEYKNYLARIETYKANVKPKLQDKAFNKACFEKTRSIKRILSQLTFNHAHILSRFNDIYTQLMSIKQESSDMYEVYLNYLAKAIVYQARQDINAKPYTAYFLARFSYLVCSTIPEFKDYLLGRLLKRCPYLIPQYHDDDPTLTDEEIRSRLRYVLAEKRTKTMESFLQHAEGQKCYVMFFGALCQTLPEAGQPENPFSAKDAWIYLARICNMPLRPITSFIILGLLQTAGKRLLEAYPNQTPKVFRLLKETIIPLMPSDSVSGTSSAVGRLNLFLDAYFEKGIADVVSEVPP